ncbi:MAG: 3-isopropylmalate dehydratase small subunit [Euryarchaeota archaeon]|nr:3-isopropylmalate dehydratase small subunit [Euryarchaeota archaeon]
MKELKLKGKVWVFGDDIDTDIITPGKFLSNPKELAEHAMAPADKSFAKGVKPGDIVVAGRNFGCGSSRETAPEVLQMLKVGGVVAEGFARIFFRNSIAIGFPLLECPGVHAAFQGGQEAEIDLEKGTIRNLATGAALHGRPLDPMLLQSIREGGMMEVLRRELREKAKALRPPAAP